MQQYTFYLFLEKCSTCFGWYLHQSSGAHITVITVSGTGQTVSAVSTPPRSRKVADTVCPVPGAVITVPRSQKVADTVEPVPDAVITVPRSRKVADTV